MKPIKVGEIRDSNGVVGDVIIHPNMVTYQTNVVLTISGAEGTEIAGILNRAEILMFPQSPPSAWLAVTPIHPSSKRCKSINLDRVLRAISRRRFHISLDQNALGKARDMCIQLVSMYCRVVPSSLLTIGEFELENEEDNKRPIIFSVLELLVESYEKEEKIEGEEKLSEEATEKWLKLFIGATNR